MLMIDNPTVEKVLDMETCIAVQEEAFRGLATGASALRARIDVWAPAEREDGYYRWGSTEGAWNGYFATRVKSDVLYWPRDDQGNPTNQQKFCVAPGTYCGLVYLFSTRNGEPLAIINDGVIQHMRVGGGGGIGAKYLSREDASSVGMIGSGGMARTYLEAISCVRDLRQCKVFSRNPDNRQRYAAEMSKELGFEVTAVDTPAEAAAGADILCSCTDSIVPTIEPDWVKPGMHLINLNGHEISDAVLARCDVKVRQGSELMDLPEEDGFVKAYDGFVAGTEEERKRIPLKVGGAHGKAKYPTFVDLVSGEATGRENADQITYYENQGNNGLQFVSSASVVYERCKEQGLGHEIPTEWFLEDIRN